MLTLEQYAAIYLPMISAAGNAQKEQEICTTHGYTLAQWEEAKNYYTSKMQDPSDMGKTAMAFSAAMMKGAAPVANPPVTQKNSTPADFNATKVSIYISEYDVQMVEFINNSTQQHIVLQLGFEANDAFEKNYINGRVHISINDQSFSLYGGVERIELSSTDVQFIFDAEGKERMQCNSVTATFSIDRKYYNYLKRKMKWMYKNILHIKEEVTPKLFQVNGISLNDEWQTFDIKNASVHLRPNIENIRDTGKYNQVVNVKYNSSTFNSDKNEQALVDEMHTCLMDTLEKDAAAIIAFLMSADDGITYFIYTYLNQNDFMSRINDAFKTLPKLPLSFSGGADEKWENYTNCLADYRKNIQA